MTKIKTKKNPFNIETPKTIEEFRNNLKKYYLCEGKDNLMVMNHPSIPIRDIDSLWGLYSKVGSEVWIVPQINLKKDILEYMDENNLSWGVEGYFEDENNFEVFDNQNEYLENGDWKWTKIDNQILREFYIWSLGEFSGYYYEEMEVN